MTRPAALLVLPSLRPPLRPAGIQRYLATRLFCIECDANSWYRWSGHAYEAELYAVGERIAIATYEQDQKLGLFARGTRNSKFLFPVEPCTQAIVLRVAGSEAERWYFVETQDHDRVRGWIPASFASESECTG